MNHTKLVLLCVVPWLIISCTSVKDVIYLPNNNGELGNSTLSMLKISEISTTTSDGLIIYSVFLRNPKSSSLIVYFHGNGGNIHNRIDALIQLRDLGYSVIGVSYRGYLNSEGCATEEGLYIDGESVLQYATSILGYSISDIILFGRSIGSAVAIDSAQFKSLKGIIVVSTFSNGKDLYETQSVFKKLLLRDTDNYIASAFPNSSKIENVTAPKLVIHGTADSIVPIALGRSIYDAASEPKKFISLEGAEHNTMHISHKKQYWSAIEMFLTVIESRNSL